MVVRSESHTAHSLTRANILPTLISLEVRPTTTLLHGSATNIFAEVACGHEKILSFSYHTGSPLQPPHCWLSLVAVALLLNHHFQTMTDPDNQIFAIDEESGWLETRAFSPGIMMIFANYVAAIMATVGEYRRLATLENDNPVTVWNMTPAARAKAYHTIQSGAVQAILLYGVLLGVSAPLVTLTARPLDPRMVYIIHGISRFVAAVILAIMSVRIAKWLGLYTSYRPVAHYYEKQRRQLMGTTVLELRHAVRWSVAKKLLRTYCVLLFLLQQAADEEDKGYIAIPFSIVAGLVTGLAVDWLSYKIRRFERERRKKYLSIALAMFLSGLSAYALGVAAFFIAYVWDDSEEALKDLEDSIWPLWAFGSGLIIMFLTHLFVWHWSKHIAATMVNNSVHSSTTTYKQRMAWSMVLSNAKLSDVIKKSSQDNPTVAETQNNQSAMAGKMDDILEEEEMEDQGLDSENRDPSFSGQMEPSVEDAENHGSLLETEPDKELEGEEQAVITVDPLYDDPVPNDTLKTTEESSLSSPRPPTRKELFMKWQCCGCVRGKDKSTGRKVYGCCSWTLYLMACFVCVFAVIVNIGASHQQEAARAKLPYVFEKLYRYMDEGPVCAFDNRGADSNITTFPDRDAAHAAGFLILHCGACAAVRGVDCVVWVASNFVVPHFSVPLLLYLFSIFAAVLRLGKFGAGIYNKVKTQYHASYHSTLI